MENANISMETTKVEEANIATEPLKLNDTNISMESAKFEDNNISMEKSESEKANVSAKRESLRPRNSNKNYNEAEVAAKRASLRPRISLDKSNNESGGQKTAKKPGSQKRKSSANRKSTPKRSKKEKEYEDYIVEAIRDKRVDDGVTQYFIKWVGYPEDENTWEPMESFYNPNMVDEFEQALAKRVAEQEAKERAKKTLAEGIKVNLHPKAIEPLQDINADDSETKPARKILGVTWKNENGKLELWAIFKEGKDQVKMPTDVIAEENPKALIEFYEGRIKDGLTVHEIAVKDEAERILNETRNGAEMDRQGEETVKFEQRSTIEEPAMFEAKEEAHVDV